MGRPTTITEAPSDLGQQTISYTYNYAGEPLSENAPTRQFDYRYDVESRLTGLYDNGNGYYFLCNRSFNAAGQIMAETMSPGHPDQTTISRAYNRDLQPWQINYNSGSLTLQYQWGASIDANGNVTSGDDDGTLQCQVSIGCH